MREFATAIGVVDIWLAFPIAVLGDMNSALAVFGSSADRFPDNLGTAVALATIITLLIFVVVTTRR